MATAQPSNHRNVRTFGPQAGDRQLSGIRRHMEWIVRHQWPARMIIVAGEVALAAAYRGRCSIGTKPHPIRNIATQNSWTAEGGSLGRITDLAGG
jgi:hypothetical protein